MMKIVLVRLGIGVVHALTQSGEDFRCNDQSSCQEGQHGIANQYGRAVLQDKEIGCDNKTMSTFVMKE